MKFSIHYKLIRAALFACALASIFPGAARAEVTDLADVPLANAPSDTVRPNLMYILDDSGSMAWDYMPDNILNLSSGTNLNNCKDNSGTIFNAQCADQGPSNWGEPPYYSFQFNQIYYTPDITYTPGLDSTGTSLGNATATAALKNPYSGTANLNLTTKYPEIYYCNFTGTPTTANLADTTKCRRNGIDNVATGTATSYFMYWSSTIQVVSSVPTLPVTSTQGGFPISTGTAATSFRYQTVSNTGHPYYFTITPNEYCADANLVNCALAAADGSAPDATHTIPAPVRYCGTTANASSASAVSDVLTGSPPPTPKCTLKFDVNNYKYPRYGRFVRTDIVPATTQYTKSATAVRTDCAAATFCTYAEELQNFANWYSYYRVRLTMMKTSTGLAFNNIDDRYRVGFITINPLNSSNTVTTAKYLPISAFNAAQKSSFYTLLYAQSTSGTTPGGTWLRAALSRVGRHYAAVHTTSRTCINGSGNAVSCDINSGMNEDPIQYSCQQNFALLTTDGYWNDASSFNGTGGPIVPDVSLTGAAIGDADDTPDSNIPPFVSRAGGTLDALGAVSTTDTPTITTEQQICTGNNNTAFNGGTGTQQACGCTGSQRRIWQRVQTHDSLQDSIEGTDNGSPSTSNTYVFTAISACTTPLIVTNTTPVTVVEQQVVLGSANSTFTSIGGVTSGMNQAGACSGGQERIKQRTTTYTSTVLVTDGTPAAAVISGVAYAFANIGTCVAPLVNTNVTQVSETEQSVCTKNNSTSFGSAANGGTGQTNCSCSSNSNSATMQRVIRYNKTVVTTDGVVASPTFSATAGGFPSYSTAVACSTAAKTPAAKTFPFTTVSNGSTGGPTPVAAASSTTNGTTTTDGPAGNGGTTLSITFAPNPTIVNGTVTTVLKTSGGTPDTLADVAMYYYKTDLRTGSSNVLAPNNVPTTDKDFTNTQHMTTFTLGLGLQGTMTYQADYETNPNSDFSKIKSASTNCDFGGGFGHTCDWPAPAVGSSTTLDDLWHTAVNGRGVYFSASDPNSLASGLYGALSALHVQTAAASASATSSPNITQTNNFIYSTTFRTVKWDGEIVAQQIDTTNGNVLPAIVWSAQAQLDGQVQASTDSRQIWKFDASKTTKLNDFLFASLSSIVTGGIAIEQNYFLNQCTVLSQCSSLTALQKTTVNDGTDLVNYLRGQKGNETTLFRQRDHTLGDPVDATPAYVQAANFNFADPVTPTYASFKTSVASRQGVLFVAANDGMLHAINGNTGAEIWAYIPRIVFPGLSQLATETWDANHKYSVDGSPQTMDVFDTTASAWKTILVGGLDKGGRGFYALDVTSPTAPKGLWEICSDSTLCAISDTDIGLSFGNPVITKRASDGRWVVLITSGMNNVSPGTGHGFLYVLDAITGAILRKVDTGAGGTATPSGFSKIQAYATSFDTDNTALFVYGGDLLGNVWRFDMSVDPPAVLQMATLVDGSGKPQSITSRPELGFISGNRVVFIGTGRYLGTSDLVDPSTLTPALQWAYQQSFYALKDKFASPCTGSCVPYGNPRTASPGLVQQTLTDNGTTSRTESKNPVVWGSVDGWFVDFNPGNSSPGERVNLDPQIVQNTILVITNVPNNSACTVGGDSFVYQFDYSSGSYAATSAGQVAGMKFTGQVLVGFVTVELPSGVFKGVATGASGTKTPFGVNTGGGSNSGRRVGWRELLQW